MYCEHFMENQELDKYSRQNHVDIILHRQPGPPVQVPKLSARKPEEKKFAGRLVLNIGRGYQDCPTPDGPPTSHSRTRSAAGPSTAVAARAKRTDHATNTEHRGELPPRCTYHPRGTIN